MVAPCCLKPRVRSPWSATVALMTAACLTVAAPHARAQGDEYRAESDALKRKLSPLADMKMVEPGPELPGDRAKSCQQLAIEMRSVMEQRGFGAQQARASVDKGCAARKKQSAARAELNAAAMIEAQKTMAAVAATAATPWAQEAAIAAATAGSEQRLKPLRDKNAKASLEMADTAADVGATIMPAVNDPRFMRLGLLMEEKNCGDMPEPEEPSVDPCTGEAIADGGMPTDIAQATGMQMHDGKPGFAPPSATAPSGAPPSVAPDDPFTRKPSTPRTQAPADDPFVR